ncbi:hypothetical protein [Flavobacterium gelatinilyticum]|uniref:hypothetical protein n=1 Tax=Flavobacterium gelatinilyticum TaxID=3003260 RepID=UPI00247FCE5F|nr:hypothetical protein [Flavobacterium gelatinilyticum]
MGILFYTVMGICGTLYPNGWRRFFEVASQQSKPESGRHIGAIGMGAIAGLAGGTLLYGRFAEHELFAGEAAVVSGLVAFASASIITGVISFFE